MTDPFHARLSSDLSYVMQLRDQAKGFFNFEVDSSLQTYTVHLNKIEALVGTEESNFIKSESHKFALNVPPQYPRIMPVIFFEKTIFHPNWWPTGQLCYGNRYNLNTTLRELIIDTVRMMQYDIVNLKSPANIAAKNWYMENKNNINRFITKKVDFPPPLSDDLSIEFCSSASNRQDEIEIIPPK